MSLADQSQQWYPTSVRVTVHQAKDLRAKGKNGTNDAYAIIQVAKDKFSTTVAEKCVTPVWKEEATFDLPLFHPGNAERCTLHVIVMHRAQVGLDKFLGQAVVNLLELHDNKARKRTDWFKLVDKGGKEDKARGQVLLDVQFMRNNMSASMFDLSMQDKPRSRISKIKDKVRGKKKDSFSDSASAIVPPVSQVLTDSEGEGDSVSLGQSPGVKKKSKFKTLFTPKSNLHRNVSQSMSTLGTLPEKNSSLSSSRSSGLNVDSPDVKKKFKFLGHKRTGSSDSRVSQGPFSLLGRSKQSDSNNLCINGSHVYAEEAEAKSGSTASLNSSGRGSVEDIQRHEVPVDVPGFSVHVPSDPRTTDRASLEQQRFLEEQRRIAEAKRLEDEERARAEALRRQQEEEQRLLQELERKRLLQEEEARRRKQREEEELRKKQQQQEEERGRQEAAEEEQRQEQLKRAEEQASMSERLTSLFGMIYKKDEKKEEVKETPPAPVAKSQDPQFPGKSANPFEEVSLSPEPLQNQSPTESNPKVHPPIPSAMVFLNRTAKVKPRLAETTDCQTPSLQSPSPFTPDSSPSPTVPSEATDSFEEPQFTLAPEIKEQGEEELSSLEDSSGIMADKKRRAPVPPSYHNGQHGGGGRELLNPAYVEPEAQQQTPRMSLPLPDYETLFPVKRHGVQGQTNWDHLIAEVNQKHRDSQIGMSVDEPGEHRETPPYGRNGGSAPVQQYQTQTPPPKPASSKSVPAPEPPKQVAPPQYISPVEASLSRSSVSVSDLIRRTMIVERPRGDSGSTRKVLHPSPRPRSPMETDRSPQGSLRIPQKVISEEAPTAKPRQKPNNNESVSENSKQLDVNAPESEFDPFPNSRLLPKDPWAQTQQFQDVDLFTGNNEKKPEEQGMTVADLDNIFSSDKASSASIVSSGVDSQPREYSSHATSQSEAKSHRERDLFATERATPEPLPVVVEEPAAGGKPIRAWVSPSEVQPVSAQSSSGGELTLSQRRPHPVKPLNPADSHQPSSTPAFKEIKVQDSALPKHKVSGPAESGPYTLLTKEELITKVVNQQVDLTRKDAKIVELEEYIDNLLVRVIEEKPSILQSLDAKPC